MAKKLSELDSDDKIYFETVMNFMNETSQDDLRQRLKVAQKFGLVLTSSFRTLSTASFACFIT